MYISRSVSCWRAAQSASFNVKRHHHVSNLSRVLRPIIVIVDSRDTASNLTLLKQGASSVFARISLMPSSVIVICRLKTMMITFQEEEEISDNIILCRSRYHAVLHHRSTYPLRIMKRSGWILRTEKCQAKASV